VAGRAASPCPTGSGEVIYTDREDYDPNTDVNLNRSDWKRTPVRPRFPQ